MDEQKTEQLSSGEMRNCLIVLILGFGKLKIVSRYEIQTIFATLLLSICAIFYRLGPCVLSIDQGEERIFLEFFGK